MRLQTPPTIGPSTNFHHSHRSGNASNAASPITVANVYASKELNKVTPSAASPLNILNNLHHGGGGHLGSESSSSNNNSSRGDARANGLFNGSLDLLNGVEYANALNGGGGSAALNRQMRLRAYGNGGKNGMVRHETKL